MPTFQNKITQNKSFILVGIIISMLIWGVSWPSAKVLSRYGAPLEIAFIRFLFTFTGVFVLLKLASVPLRVHKSGFISLGIASVLMAFYSILFFSGIKNGMPGAGGVLVTTLTPFITYILALIITKRIPTMRERIGMLLGICAGAILLSVWNQYEHILESGNLYFLASCIVWAFLSRITSHSSTHGSPLAFSLWVYLSCIVILSFFVNLTNVKNILVYGDAMFWGNMIFNAIVNTGMATTFYFYATSKLGPERTSSFLYIVPFGAVLSSLLFLNETLKWNTVVGGFIGLSAVWIINRKNKSPEVT